VLLVNYGDVDLLPLDESDFALVDGGADFAGDGCEHSGILGYRTLNRRGRGPKVRSVQSKMMTKLLLILGIVS
jgi:hypothetical protein